MNHKEYLPVSVVIPTCNRYTSLLRTLTSINKQVNKPTEIIIVDASDEGISVDPLSKMFPTLNLVSISSIPSVCVQRNIGIGSAKSEWVFLCDDDIELSPDYLSLLYQYTLLNKRCGVVSGMLMQKEEGVWVSQYLPGDVWGLLWRYIFQQSVWGNIDLVKGKSLFKPLLEALQNKYKKTGNTRTKAGWPLVTNWSDQVIHASFYSMGANLIKREWLINSPYDEVLDASGIGDNYGVALGFPQALPFNILSYTMAYHHRDKSNRLATHLAYYRRVLALDYFNHRWKKDSSTKLWLIWSLTGNLFFSLIRLRWQMVMANYSAIIKIALNKNPYQIAHLRGDCIISPKI